MPNIASPPPLFFGSLTHVVPRLSLILQKSLGTTFKRKTPALSAPSANKKAVPKLLLQHSL